MATLLPPALEGFGLGLGIIVAIGAQNAFVLRQGLEGRHVLLACLICALSVALLIAAGVAGFGALIAAAPWLPRLLAALGAVFLLWYGITRFRCALRPQALIAADRTPRGRRAVAIQCLAFTWLNPHVYLDTVVIIGAASVPYIGGAKATFALGAIFASFLFFFCLGLFARAMAPMLSHPAVWRIFDVAIGLLMGAIAIGLVRYVLDRG